MRQPTQFTFLQYSLFSVPKAFVEKTADSLEIQNEEAYQVKVCLFQVYLCCSFVKMEIFLTGGVLRRCFSLLMSVVTYFILFRSCILAFSNHFKLFENTA